MTSHQASLEELLHLATLAGRVSSAILFAETPEGSQVLATYGALKNEALTAVKNYPSLPKSAGELYCIGVWPVPSASESTGQVRLALLDHMPASALGQLSPYLAEVLPSLLSCLATSLTVGNGTSAATAVETVAGCHSKVDAIALCQRHEGMLKALEAADIGTWQWDFATDDLVVSDNLPPLYGLPAHTGQVSCAQLYDRMHPDDVERVRSALQAAIRQDTFYECEFRVILPGGETRWLAERGKTVSSEDGKPLCMIGATLDASERVRVQQALAETLQRYHSLFHDHPDAVYSFDLQGNFIEMNLAGQQRTGYTLEEWRQMNFADVVLPEDLPEVERHFQAAAAGHAEHYNCRTRTKDGKTQYLDVTNIPLRQDGRIVGVYGISRNITDMVEAQEALKESKELFKIVAETTNDVIWTWAIDQDRIWWNDGVQRVLGYAVDEAPRTFSEWLSLIHPDDQEQVQASIQAAISSASNFWHQEYRYRKKTGSYADITNRGKITRTPKGQPLSLIGAFIDTTERKETEARLTYLAQKDALTGLANRALFNDHLPLALHAAERRREAVALMFLDLDRFKEINDALGHEVGDAVLKTIAARLQEALPGVDTIARLGGDEFTVILDNLQEGGQDITAACSTVAQRIIKTVEAPIRIGERDVFVNTSIGIALYPEDANDPELLIRRADAAMYYAKAQGRNNYQFYSPIINSRAVERLEMETALRRALERQELYLLYQPQQDLLTGKIIGVEALLRWQSPLFGLVSPVDFIPLAEESGLIVPIGEWVIQEACHQAARWQQAGVTPFKMAVNLSARQMKSTGLVDAVRNALAQSGLEPSRLELELTEALLIDNPVAAQQMLQELRNLGVQLSIDDFGTGYSNLSYLKQLQVDVLKIDRSFISDSTAQSEEMAIASAIVAMAHHLKLKVVAEGVETEAQRDFLRHVNCDYLQGFLLSPPVQAHDLTSLMQKGTQVNITAF